MAAKLLVSAAAGGRMVWIMGTREMDIFRARGMCKRNCWSAITVCMRLFALSFCNGASLGRRQMNFLCLQCALPKFVFSVCVLLFKYGRESTGKLRCRAKNESAKGRNKLVTYIYILSSQRPSFNTKGRRLKVARVCLLRYLRPNYFAAIRLLLADAGAVAYYTAAPCVLAQSVCKSFN